MAYIGFDVEARLHNETFNLDTYVSDGSTDIYTLSIPKPVTSRALLVTFDGVLQTAETDYKLDENSNLKLLSIPSNSAKIVVLHLTRPVTLYQIPDRSITSSKIAGDITVPGNLTVSGQLNILGQETEEDTGPTTTLPSLAVQDTMLTLNAAETGSGVTASSAKAGLKIERGQLADKEFTWDENNDKWSTNGDSIITNIVGTVTGSSTLNVLKNGDTMTGRLTLSADPVDDLHAATKTYVDRKAFIQALLI